MCSPEGNFDIDAGDGVGWGPFRTPQITTNHKQIVRTKIVHTSGTFSKNVQKHLYNIFIYTEKDNEADKRIKNNNV